MYLSSVENVILCSSVTLLSLFCRETMLQALRFVIQGAGAKVDPTIRKNIITTLLSMLGHDEVQLLVRVIIKL